MKKQINLFPREFRRPNCFWASRWCKYSLITVFILLTVGGYKYLEIAGKSAQQEIVILQREVEALENEKARLTALAARIQSIETQQAIEEQLGRFQLQWSKYLDYVDKTGKDLVQLERFEGKTSSGRLILFGTGKNMRKISLYVHNLLKASFVDEAQLILEKKDPNYFQFQITVDIQRREEGTVIGDLAETEQT